MSSDEVEDVTAAHVLHVRPTKKPTKETSITDFFQKKRGRKRRKNKRTGRGRPKKICTTTTTLGKECDDDHNIILSSSSDTEEDEDQGSNDHKGTHTTSSSTSVPTPTTTTKTNRKRIQWHRPEYFPILQRTIIKKRSEGKLFNQHENILNEARTIVPEGTLRDVMKRLGNKEPTLANCFHQQQNALLSNESIDLLQDIICKRDQTNSGVSRAEAITIIVDLGQAKCRKSAENHLDYLIRKKKLPRFKRNGRIITAQATTSERCQINTKQQFRWHFLIESEWAHLRTVNQPTDAFRPVHAHFQVNIDETCFMCCDGVLRILGDGEKKHHDKNLQDSRVSITVLRCGSAAGTHGPVIFLLKGGKRVNRLFSKKRLKEALALPEG